MRRQARTLLPFLALGIMAFALASCASSNDQADTAREATDAPTVSVPTETTAEPVVETTADTEPVTVGFNDDFGTSVAPILATNCASCHSNDGPGTTHWNLATAADAVKEATSIAAAVSVGAMPPWPASHESVAFNDDRSLSDDEIAAIVDWANAGAELDVDPTTPIVGTAQLGLAEIDAVVAPSELYVGSVLNTDDYRCLIYDPELTEAEALTGYNFVPDQTQVVHHAIGFLVRADGKQQALDRDAAEPGAGWECYGGSGLDNDEMLIGWAPGQDAAMFPDGSGYVLEPGDFFVLQIHYHYDTEAPADASELQLDLGVADDLDRLITVRQYVGPVEIPCMTSQAGPLCDRAAAMERAIARFGPEGVRSDGINFLCDAKPEDFAAMTDGRVSSSCVLPAYGFGEIVAILGHEHEIGASFRMTLNPGTPDELILLDIPKWDFNWQYNYAPVDSITLKPGDTIGLECSWDRLLADPDIEPSYILWADGTNDEMCFATIATME